MSEKKKFAIVKFIQANNIEVIPSTWLLSNTLGRWPNTKSLPFTERCIRECAAPQESWDVLDLKVLSFSKTFKTANAKARIALDTSNLDTSSEEEFQEQRKRKKNMKYCDSEDEINIKKRVISPSKGLARNSSNGVNWNQSSSEEESSFKAAPKQFIPPKVPNTRVPTIHKVPLPTKNYSGRVSSQCSESQSLISPRIVHSNTVPPIPNEKVPETYKSLITSGFQKVFEMLEGMKNEIKSLRQDQINFFNRPGTGALEEYKGDSSLLLELPTGVQLPLAHDDQLTELEGKLTADKNFQCAMIRYLDCVSSGKTPATFILNLCRRLLTKDLALTYSRLGRKGKKCFESLPAVTNVILATSSRHFGDMSRQELAEKFGRVLATAADWEGRKPKSVGDCVTVLETENSLELNTYNCIEEFNKMC